MAIEKMTLLNVKFCKDELEKVLFHLYSFHDFYPRLMKDVDCANKYQNYDNILNDVKRIASYISLDISQKSPYQYSMNIQDAKMMLYRIEDDIVRIKSSYHQCIKEKQNIENRQKVVNFIETKQRQLIELQKCHYLSIRFGRITRKSLKNIQSYDDHPYLFGQLGNDQQYILCYYIVSSSLEKTVNNIMNALGFEEIKIPLIQCSTQEELKQQMIKIEDLFEEINQNMKFLKERYALDLIRIYQSISFLCEIEKYKDYVVDYQNYDLIQGFVSQHMLERFKEKMKDFSKIEELSLDDIEESEEIPFIVKNAKIVKPFEIISQIQKGDTVDTTAVIAILYSLVFMILLGDIGVGAIMSLLGLSIRKKTMGMLLLSLGLSALCGGLLYGCVFYVIDIYRGLLIMNGYRIIYGFFILIVGTLVMGFIKNIYKKR